VDFRARLEVTGPLLAQGPAVVQKLLDLFVDEATMFLLREVQIRTPQGVYGAQGGLLKSIQRPPIEGRGTPVVKGRVVTAQPYGEVIEKGRRPGKAWPPPKVLVPWIEQKLGLPPKEAARVEYAIRRKIGMKGFEGVHMFERALTENFTTLQTMAEREGLLIVQELNA
jgi:hypothetical protein